MKKIILFIIPILLCASFAFAGDDFFTMGELNPVDSKLKVKVGEEAPDFTLPSVDDTKVTLSDFRGHNVVLSFVPAAWTPVCSDQWPGYRLAEELFHSRDAIVLGISVDNTPTQKAWIQKMGGLPFTVLSDFYPHGEVAKKFGILRSNGVSERAIFVIDRTGIIRYINVNDINKRPDLGAIVKVLDSLS